MLQRFTFENAFCFLGENTLSMLPSGDRRHPNHISRSSRANSKGVLRAAGIYGANAHGKTKLVDAILFLKRMAFNGEEGSIEDFFTPFKLAPSAQRAPSRFVVNFRTKRADYEYGLVIRNYSIEQEWLFEREKRQEVMLFSRERIESRNPDEKYRFKFGAKLRSTKSPSSRVAMDDYLQVVGAGLSESETFLSQADQKKIRRLRDCQDWFRYTLQIVKADSRYGNLHFEAAEDEKFLKYLSDSLSNSDTGIGQLRIKKTKVTDELLEKIPIPDPEMLPHIKRLEPDEIIALATIDGPLAVIKKENDGFSFLRFVATHKAAKGEEIEFDMEEESSGTRRMMDLYPMLYSLIERDSVYVVDELDRKLHPLLAYNFVEQFLNQDRGQLIFTTHTTHMLDLELLRRDEIWLVQKRKDGASELYSLADFKVRPDLDIRKGYLQGRFGGVPFVGDARALGWY